MNAASPATQTFSESHSLYPTTPGGEMEPTQCAALCHALIACGLFTLIVLSSSMIRPPPSAACHSSASQVNTSSAPPSPHKAQNLFFPFACSACLNSSRHGLQLIPGPGWLTISILSQKVGAIIQKSDVGTIRYGHQLVIHGVAGSHGRKLEGDFVGEIWLE